MRNATRLPDHNLPYLPNIATESIWPCWGFAASAQRSADLLVLFLGLRLLSFHNLQNPADALLRLSVKRKTTCRQEALPLPHPVRLATSLDAPLAATAVHGACGFAGQRADTAAEVQTQCAEALSQGGMRMRSHTSLRLSSAQLCTAASNSRNLYERLKPQVPTACPAVQKPATLSSALRFHLTA